MVETLDDGFRYTSNFIREGLAKSNISSERIEYNAKNQEAHLLQDFRTVMMPTDDVCLTIEFFAISSVSLEFMLHLLR